MAQLINLRPYVHLMKIDPSADHTYKVSVRVKYENAHLPSELVGYNTDLNDCSITDTRTISILKEETPINSDTFSDTKEIERDGYVSEPPATYCEKYLDTIVYEDDGNGVAEELGGTVLHYNDADEIYKAPSPLTTQDILPHLYLSKLPGDNYKLHVHLSGLESSSVAATVNDGVIVGSDRQIVIDVNSNVSGNGEKTLNTITVSEAEVGVTQESRFLVIVKDRDGSERGKGIIHHADADEKGNTSG